MSIAIKRHTTENVEFAIDVLARYHDRRRSFWGYLDTINRILQILLVIPVAGLILQGSIYALAPLATILILNLSDYLFGKHEGFFDKGLGARARLHDWAFKELVTLAADIARSGRTSFSEYEMRLYSISEKVPIKHWGIFALTLNEAYYTHGKKDRVPEPATGIKRWWANFHTLNYFATSV